MSEVTIYHNPDCGTSRKVLAMIRAAGIEPQVVLYLETPPDRSTLAALISATREPARALLREKGTPFAELGLADELLTEEELVDAMLEHPILINRPIVVTSLGTRLCRPPETVFGILPTRGAIAGEGPPLAGDRGRTAD